VNIALRELLSPALGFSQVVVEGRSRALVLIDGQGSWGSSRRFVAYMADPVMVPTREFGAPAAPRNSFGSPTTGEAAYFS